MVKINGENDDDDPLLPRCVRQTGQGEHQLHHLDQDKVPWYSWTSVADNRAIEKTTNGGAERCQYLGRALKQFDIEGTIEGRKVNLCL